MLFAHFLVLFLVILAVSADRLRPRQLAPEFKAKAVLADKFVDVSLADSIKSNQWTVLLFYPFDYTFVCPVSGQAGTDGQHSP